MEMSAIPNHSHKHGPVNSDHTAQHIQFFPRDSLPKNFTSNVDKSLGRVASLTSSPTSKASGLLHPFAWLQPIRTHLRNIHATTGLESNFFSQTLLLSSKIGPLTQIFIPQLFCPHFRTKSTPERPSASSLIPSKKDSTPPSSSPAECGHFLF